MNRFALLRAAALAPLASLAAPLAKIAAPVEAVTWRFIEEQPEVEGICRSAPGWWRFNADGISGELVFPK
jgi:hypothetical protein